MGDTHGLLDLRKGVSAPALDEDEAGGEGCVQLGAGHERQEAGTGGDAPELPQPRLDRHAVSMRDGKPNASWLSTGPESDRHFSLWGSQLDRGRRAAWLVCLSGYEAQPRVGVVRATIVRSSVGEEVSAPYVPSYDVPRREPQNASATSGGAKRTSRAP